MAAGEEKGLEGEQGLKPGAPLEEQLTGSHRGVSPSCPASEPPLAGQQLRSYTLEFLLLVLWKLQIKPGAGSWDGAMWAQLTPGHQQIPNSFLWADAPHSSLLSSCSAPEL